MRVLDMFAGLGGWSAAFRDRGHEVVTTDNDPRFDVTVLKDVLELRREDLPFTDFDIILASPPCEGFTVMNLGKNWGQKTLDLPPDQWHTPKTPQAEMAVRLVRRTRQIIEALQPRWFVIENPRAKLRQLPVVADLERRTVWYCHLGETTAKPTDLWGGFPPSLALPAVCHNRRAGHGDDCCCTDHVAAPRGSRTPGSTQGTQGPDADALRAEIPYGLSLTVCLAAEADLEGAARWTPTSPSSPASAVSTSPSSGSGSDASDRSRSTSTAPASSSDTGPTSPGGAMLLPTPTAGDAKSAGSRNLPGSGAAPGTSLTDAVRSDRVKSHGHGMETPLLPTPSAEGSKGETSPDLVRRGAKLVNERTGRILQTNLATEVKQLLPTPQTAYDGRTDGAWSAAKQRAAQRHREGEYAAGTGPPGMMDLQRALTLSAEGSPASPSPTPDGARRSTTRAGSGPSSPVLWMSYDPDGSSSRTSPDSSLLGWIPGPGRRRKDGRLLKSSRIWPTWGSMHGGSVFALPISVPPTAESASSSSPSPPETADPSNGSGLLPTPKTPTGGAESRGPRRERGSGGADLEGQIRADLLPTPTQRDHKGERTGAYKPGDQLPEAIGKVSRGGPTNPRSEGGSA